jgi:PKD repeat protein
VLKDAIGPVKDSVFYLPTAPWPTTPNNGGPSLTLCDPTLDNSLPGSWAASSNQVAVNGLGQPIYASPGSGCQSGAKLVITEIMYNSPETGTDSLEFLELYNNGNGINLNGFYFSDGVVFTFPSDSLAPGQYILVAGHSSAIQNTFGKPSLQWTSGALSNSGESITLRDNYGNIIDQVEYGVTEPWPPSADGQGPSLTLCDPNSDNTLAINWKASTEFAAVNAANDTIFATPLGGCVNPPAIANFKGFPLQVVVGGTVQFTDLSANDPIAWEWTFPGGTPSTSINQNPLIQYNTYGIYSVSLKATNAFGNSTLTKTDYITVGNDGISLAPTFYSVYPNPTSGELFVSNTNKDTIIISVFSSLGVEVKSVESSANVISTDLGGLPPGIYLLKLETISGQSVKSIKVILK